MDFDKYLKLSNTIRKDILVMLKNAGSGHPGGSLSCVELIVALYFKFLKHDPKNPFLEDRDRLILSKGHACPTQYACLAEVGYFSKDELFTLRKICSRLQGHPGFKCSLPGIEVSTGSLGQGLSIGSGMALGYKLDKKSGNIYVLLGDGELQSGQIWEAILTASHYKLNNLCAIVDYNSLQIDGRVENIKNIMPIKEKFESFGWNTITIDGHKYKEIFDGYEKFIKNKDDNPSVIIAKTIKGKGVSFMEDNVDWHGKAPNARELEMAILEIDNSAIGL
ncbi:MAG: transketolase [Elusimicrobiota bacterium]|jgi:transketolase|nr:transketolase [Elusimicrobiota bacterium]